jgi:hypothetical protein
MVHFPNASTLGSDEGDPPSEDDKIDDLRAEVGDLQDQLKKQKAAAKKDMTRALAESKKSVTQAKAKAAAAETKAAAADKAAKAAATALAAKDKQVHMHSPPHAGSFALFAAECKRKDELLIEESKRKDKEYRDALAKQEEQRRAESTRNNRQLLSIVENSRNERLLATAEQLKDLKVAELIVKEMTLGCSGFRPSESEQQEKWRRPTGTGKYCGECGASI